MIFKLLLIYFFILGCDQFREGVEAENKPSFITSDSLVKLDCSTLFLLKGKISKVKFYKNNKFLKQVSGFEIQKARHCPTLPFDWKKDKVSVVVSLLENDKTINCKLDNNKIKC